MKHNICDFDFIFLSYDEPNCEELYAELANTIPWCKRVHGIHGFDAAHRRCADIADTNFFITIDGDNKIYPEFLDYTIDIECDQEDHAWTWAGRNHINGLVYGNGGLKLWSKRFVYGMKSHEMADDNANKVDFCWGINYHELFGCYSTTITNSTPYQAWRSGFREGVKMSLDRGNRVAPNEFLNKIWHGNINRLSIWANIGTDVENGIWSIYGTRMGCCLATIGQDDYTFISDYNLMINLWNTVKNNDPYEQSEIIGKELNTKLGVNLMIFDEQQSRFFKSVYMNPPRPWLGDKKIQHYMATRYV